MQRELKKKINNKNKHRNYQMVKFIGRKKNSESTQMGKRVLIGSTKSQTGKWKNKYAAGSEEPFVNV